MTRKELYGEFEGESYENIINYMLDDFESRTCENCKHLNKFDRCTLNVQNGSPICNGEVLYKMKDFGCNKFERKIV